MHLQTFEVQYETATKKPNEDNGYLQIGTFQAYDERHLQIVMKEQLGYYPPIYYIIPPETSTPQLTESAMPVSGMKELRQWVIEERNKAHINCLEDQKNAYN